MNGLRKVWRESASLLLLSKSPAKSPATCNYDVLVMKRSTASKFMANAIVFPGGVIEKSDSAGNWLDLYRDLGVDDKHLAALKNSRNKDFIYCRGEEEIDRELSLRIVGYFIILSPLPPLIRVNFRPLSGKPLKKSECCLPSLHRT